MPCNMLFVLVRGTSVEPYHFLWDPLLTIARFARLGTIIKLCLL